MKTGIFLLIAMCFAGPAFGEIQSATHTYQHDDVTLEGYLAQPKVLEGKVPGILVVPDWMGVSDHYRRVADKLADMGYVALVVDVYGKGVRPAERNEAAQLAGKYKSDRKLLRARMSAALDDLEKTPHVDQARIAAVGYCFGGTSVLELARDGAPLIGVVTVHGGLETPTPADAKNIKAKVLVLHGADDPFVKPAEVAAFQEEMRGGNVDWQVVLYSNAVHSFSVPAAGNDNSKGNAYNELADKRSWQAMKDFFGEIFGAR